jgi:hypothetical protein
MGSYQSWQHKNRILELKTMAEIKKIDEHAVLEYVYNNRAAFAENGKNAIDTLMNEPNILVPQTRETADGVLNTLKINGYITGDRTSSGTRLGDFSKPTYWWNVYITDDGKDYIERLNNRKTPIFKC